MTLVMHDISLKTFEQCLEAVKQNGMALLYVKDYYGQKRHTELCMAAVQQNGLALMYVPENLKQLHQICMVAVKQNPYAILIVERWEKMYQYPEIYLEALKSIPELIKSLSHQSQLICLNELRRI